ncbi:hypothetical protein EDD21DRAFT_357565 [Dissophora ornata]|nr:hypothetical protein EDD21DRAFT_357565 [Dissophora ornata]
MTKGFLLKPLHTTQCRWYRWYIDTVFLLMMGLYLFSAGCARKVIDVIHRAGLNVSYPTVNRLLQSLTDDALKKVRLVAKQESWFLVYDNINFSKRKHDQRIGNSDEFESGTTATLIVGRILGIAPQIRDMYSRLYSDDFYIDHATFTHFKKVCLFHFVQELSENLDGYARCSTPTLELHRLPTKLSRTYPLPAMKIDQSTVAGNKSAVDIIVDKVLQLDKSWFNLQAVIASGDLMTVERLRQLKFQLQDERESRRRLDWVLPISQPFHIQMCLANAILRNYRGRATEQGSLQRLSTMLRRKRIFSDNPDFHAVDDFL